MFHPLAPDIMIFDCMDIPNQCRYGYGFTQVFGNAILEKTALLDLTLCRLRSASIGRKI